MRNVLILDGVACISDMETYVFVPIKRADGYYRMDKGELTYLGPVDDQYQVPDDQPKKYVPVGMYQSFDLVRLSVAADRDPIRPVMSSVHLENDYMTATDKHLMRYMENEQGKSLPDFSVNFILNPALAKIFQIMDMALKVSYYHFADNDRNFGYVSFELPDKVVVKTRLVTDTYPQVKHVIPIYDDATFAELSETLIREMVEKAKAIKSSRVFIYGSKLHLANLDKKIHESWPLTVVNKVPKTIPSGLLMPLMVSESFQQSVETGLDINLLFKMLTLYRGTITIAWTDPQRAIGLWINDGHNSEPDVRQRVSTPSEKLLTKMGKNKKAVKEEPEEVDEEEPEEMDEVDEGTGDEPEMEEATGSDDEREDTLLESNPYTAKWPRELKKSHHKKKVDGVYLVEYNEKSVALLGEGTKSLRDQLWAAGGKYSPRLQFNSRRVKGWIFPRRNAEKVKNILY